VSEGWLDMSGFPEVDPDQAVAPSELGLLREILLHHEVAVPDDLADPGQQFDGGHW